MDFPEAPVVKNPVSAEDMGPGPGQENPTYLLGATNRCATATRARALVLSNKKNHPSKKPMHNWRKPRQ